MSLPYDEDTSLVRQIQAGNKKAFEVLVLKYQQKVFNRCYSFLEQNKEEAEDAMQDVFCNAYFNIHSFGEEALFSTWLYSITRNHCLNQLRKKKVKLLEIIETQHGTPNDIVHKTQKSALLDCVRQKIKKLGEKHQTVVTLIHLDGLSQKEAAEVLKCPTGTVKSRLTRALEKLTPLLKDCLNLE